MNLDLIGIENNKDYNYMVFDIPYVRENQQAFVNDSQEAHVNFNKKFKNNNLGSTWSYSYYNIFTLAAFSLHYFYLYKVLTFAIRHYVSSDQPLWMQSWLNYHYPKDILTWHSHKETMFHGYISIDPKNTNTRFEKYSIKNEIGRLYIGPSENFHEVVVNESFNTPRITIAFDVANYTSSTLLENTNINLSFIPVL